ncbi:Uma2 family endonuclease [Coleofasciculus sp. FACHB-712]|uniref:Uma2 family endonuclease n=1 Tax=Coleofasciculus sp. FACHB-712 TaxID=2692789 RepID=UPI0016880DA7|nr:Uma2 family endonuclease [Coleofasciculus sp. FACHB-712]MBD1942721.1 Uma2 family endonuclease [Coleofasciculus sp. FACHB-712]
MTALTVNFNPIIKLTDEQFFQLCQVNENLRFERTATGELIIMSPAGGETGNRNGRLTQQLFNWADTNKLGIAFDSSTGFKLPNGADRSPDAAWLKLERWETLTSEQKEKFIPLCPDFVIELLSPSDTLKVAQEKMKEYRENGTILGLLINRKSKQVEIYRQGQAVEVLKSPTTLSGEDVLPGFVLNLEPIW